MIYCVYPISIMDIYHDDPIYDVTPYSWIYNGYTVNSKSESCRTKKRGLSDTNCRLPKNHMATFWGCFLSGRPGHALAMSLKPTLFFKWPGHEKKA